MVKRSRENATGRNRETASRYCDRKQFLKCFSTEDFRNYDQKYTANLTVASHGITHTVEDYWPVDPPCNLPSKLRDFPPFSPL